MLLVFMYSYVIRIDYPARAKQRRRHPPDQPRAAVAAEQDEDEEEDLQAGRSVGNCRNRPRRSRWRSRAERAAKRAGITFLEEFQAEHHKSRDHLGSGHWSLFCIALVKQTPMTCMICRRLRDRILAGESGDVGAAAVVEAPEAQEGDVGAQRLLWRHLQQPRRAAWEQLPSRACTLCV